MNLFGKLWAPARRYWSNNVLLVFAEPERKRPAKLIAPVIAPVGDSRNLAIAAAAPSKLTQWRRKVKQRRAALDAWENEGGSVAPPPRKS